MVEVSKEEGENIENSSHTDDMSNGKQQFVSPSPQVSTVSFTPQLDVSYTPPPQSTAENSEYAQPPAPNEDNVEGLSISNTLGVEQPPASIFSPSQSFTNPSFQQPNSIFGSPQTAPEAKSGTPLFGGFSYLNKYVPQQSQGDDDDKRSEASLLDDNEEDDRFHVPNNEQSHMHRFFSQPDLSTSENTSVSQLQNKLYQAYYQIHQLEQRNQELYEDYCSMYNQVQQLEQENQRLNAATQGLEKTEELKSAFSAYLEKRGKELREQIQKLTDESHEENKEQEIAGLIHRLHEINIYLTTGELNAGLIEELSKDAPSRELGEENKQMEEPNAEVEKLKKDLEAKNTEVQQLQKKNKELEAKKQPTEQSKAPTYTAAGLWSRCWVGSIYCT